MAEVILADLGDLVDIYVGDKNVGYIQYVHGSHPDFGNGVVLPHGYVYSAFMAIKLPYRGKGIGTKAYKMFIGLMKAKGERVIVAIPLSKDSERFIRRLGFRPIDESGPMPWNLYKTDHVFELHLKR